MRRALFVLSASFLIFASTSIAQTDRPDAWRADLATLVERLEARHPDPYHTVSEAGFESRMEELASRVPRLEDHQIVVKLARIMALVGDGHTGVFVPWDFEWGRFPLEVWNLDEGLLTRPPGSGTNRCRERGSSRSVTDRRAKCWRWSTRSFRPTIASAGGASGASWSSRRCWTPSG